MCISTLFSVLAVVSGILGLGCTAALSGKQKIMASRAAGILEFIAGTAYRAPRTFSP